MAKKSQNSAATLSGAPMPIQVHEDDDMRPVAVVVDGKSLVAVLGHASRARVRPQTVAAPAAFSAAAQADRVLPVVVTSSTRISVLPETSPWQLKLPSTLPRRCDREAPTWGGVSLVRTSSFSSKPRPVSLASSRARSEDWL